MINRRITILGPEGTNVYVIFQYLIFCVISWFTLFNITNEIGLDIQNVLVRQITFTLLGLTVFFLFTYVSISNIFALSNVLMISSTILLIGVLFTAESLGARRRYDLGVFDFQPSEFTKIAFVIFLAAVISQKRNNLLALALIFSNVLLVYSQPDLGTTIILLSVVLGMYFISDVKVKTLFAFLITMFLSFFILLELDLVSSFQVQRITDFYSAEIQDFSQKQSRLQISLGGFLGDSLSNTKNISISMMSSNLDIEKTFKLQNINLKNIGNTDQSNNYKDVLKKIFNDTIGKIKEKFSIEDFLNNVENFDTEKLENKVKDKLKNKLKNLIN